MKTILTRPLVAVALVLAALGGSVFASTDATIDDLGIDYADTEVTTAYPTLRLDEGALVFALDDAASPDALPAIAFVVPEVDRTDIFGDAAHADLNDVDDFEYGSDRIEYTHQDADLQELASAYRESLEQLGFNVESVLHTNANHVTLDATSADGSIRVVLHQTAGDVTAALFAV